MDKFLEKWQSLSTREQLYVKLGSIFVAFLIIYYGLVSPLSSSVTSLRQQTLYQQSLVVWMKPRVQALQRTTGSKTSFQAVSQTELLPTIDKRLKNSAFAGAVDEINQTSSNGVRVSFKEVPFDELMAWLAQQWQSSHIMVSDIDVQKGEKVGIAKVSVTLSI